MRGLYSDGDILYNIILNILYQPTNSSLSSDFLTESHPVSARARGARQVLIIKFYWLISVLWFPLKVNYLEPEQPAVSSFSCVILPGIVFQKIKRIVRTTSCLCEDMIVITCLNINIALSSSLLQYEVNLPGHLKSRESNWFQLSGQQWSALFTAQLSLIYIVLQSGHHLTTFTK